MVGSRDTFAADLGDCEFIRRKFNADASADLCPPVTCGDRRNAEFGDPDPTSSGTAGSGSATPATGSSQPAPAPQVTVNVNAMDSRSFMDHSTDIANAVREAMLNMHPINGVVASLYGRKQWPLFRL